MIPFIEPCILKPELGTGYFVFLYFVLSLSSFMLIRTSYSFKIEHTREIGATSSSSHIIVTCLEIVGSNGFTIVIGVLRTNTTRKVISSCLSLKRSRQR